MWSHSCVPCWVCGCRLVVFPRSRQALCVLLLYVKRGFYSLLPWWLRLSRKFAGRVQEGVAFDGLSHASIVMPLVANNCFRGNVCVVHALLPPDTLAQSGQTLSMLSSRVHTGLSRCIRCAQLLYGTACIPGTRMKDGVHNNMHFLAACEVQHIAHCKW